MQTQVPGVPGYMHAQGIELCASTLPEKFESDEKSITISFFNLKITKRLSGAVTVGGIYFTRVLHSEYSSARCYPGTSTRDTRVPGYPALHV